MSDSGELDQDGVASLVLRALPDASVIVFTLAQVISFAGGRALARDGLDASQIEGQTVGQLLAERGWGSHEPLFAGALEGRSASIEIDATDGRWCLLDVEPLRDADGQVVAGACFMRDGTEHKRLIDELRQRGQLMDLAHDAIIVREPVTSAITYWNREASELYGYSAADARGRVRSARCSESFPRAEPRG
jgi:PAS domain S-box-containing protein